MEITLVTMMLFSVCLACEPTTKYFSKGFKVFSEVIGSDLEKEDFLEIMKYIGSRSHWQRCEERMLTLLNTTDQQGKEIRALTADLTDYKQRSEETIQTLLNTTDQQGKEIQTLTADLTDYKQRSEETIQTLLNTTDQQGKEIQRLTADLTDCKERSEEANQTLLNTTDQQGKEIQRLTADLTDYKQRSEETIQTLLETINQQGKEIQTLSASLVQNHEQLRNEISQTKLDLSVECSNIANDSRVRYDEIQQAMVEQNNQLKQAFCDLESFESCLSGNCCFEQTVTTRNMALGKTAWQSSVYYSDKGDASVAVDGNRNTDLSAGKSCFHTKKEDHPWWMVDLGAEKQVGRVVMVNRGDGSYTRLRNVVVSVSLEKDGDGLTCGTFEGPGGKGQVITINCMEEIRGRFVILAMNSTNFFHLCEVEVYRN